MSFAWAISPPPNNSIVTRPDVELSTTFLKFSSTSLVRGSSAGHSTPNRSVTGSAAVVATVVEGTLAVVEGELAVLVVVAD
jgi:hypothetical protein